MGTTHCIGAVKAKCAAEPTLKNNPKPKSTQSHNQQRQLITEASSGAEILVGLKSIDDSRVKLNSLMTGTFILHCWGVLVLVSKVIVYITTYKNREHAQEKIGMLLKGISESVRALSNRFFYSRVNQEASRISERKRNCIQDPSARKLVLLFLSLSLHNGLAEGSRAYPLGCSQEATSYYDYDNCPFPPPLVPVRYAGEYMLVDRLGTGKFGDVFSAVDTALISTSHKAKLPGEAKIDPSSLVVVKVNSTKATHLRISSALISTSINSSVT